MSAMQRYFPWIIGLLAAGYVAAVLFRPAAPSAVDWSAIARIPVSADGRVKPLDSFARNSLMRLSGRQTFERDGGRGEAIEWLLELMSSPARAGERHVFRIDHPDVVSLSGLPEEKRTRFSFKEVTANFEEVMKQAEAAGRVPQKERDPFQREIAQLEDRLVLYLRIARMETPYTIKPMQPGEEWRPLAAVLADPDLAAHPSAKAVIGILSAYAEFIHVQDAERAASDAADEATSSVAEQASMEVKERDAKEAVGTAARLYSLLLDSSGDSRKAGYEVTFNRVQPFYQ